MQTSFSQANLDEGKALFKANCGSCHASDMASDLTGPALGGVQERWEGREEQLYSWIQNSGAYLAQNPDDKYVQELYVKWKKTAMTAFPALTKPQMDNILAYIDGVNTGVYPPKPVGGPGDDIAGVTADDGGSNTLLYGTLALILGILALVLARIVSNLNHMAKVNAGLPAPARQSLWEIVTGKSVVGFVIFGLVLFGGYTTVTNAVDLGRTQGYAPEQPIKFSHETHAGMNEIDCQYCHDGARRSKHSVIPAANTCMNCHTVVKNGSEYGTAEISKIYASIGYDPVESVYKKGRTEAEIEADMRKWIIPTFVTAYNKENPDTPIDETSPKALAEFDRQWNGITTSLKNDVDGKIEGPINWVRIHNLPDHVYFNHAQHVTVGEVECQTCHGPVEEMKVLAQYAPLSMGWCVNCHRQTDVKFTDNEYYASYENYHKELKEGKRESVKVEDIGGIECQKCHY